MPTLLENQKLIRHSGPVASGTSAVEPGGIDTTGFGRVAFICAVGTIASTGTVSATIQTSSDNSTFADVSGASVTLSDSDDDKLVAVELNSPGARYVRLRIVRGTANSDIDGIVCLLGDPNTAPTTHDSSVAATSVS